MPPAQKVGQDAATPPGLIWPIVIFCAGAFLIFELLASPAGTPYAQNRPQQDSGYDAQTAVAEQTGTAVSETQTVEAYPTRTAEAAQTQTAAITQTQTAAVFQTQTAAARPPTNTPETPTNTPETPTNTPEPPTATTNGSASTQNTAQDAPTPTPTETIAATQTIRPSATRAPNDASEDLIATDGPTPTVTNTPTVTPETNFFLCTAGEMLQIEGMGPPNTPLILTFAGRTVGGTTSDADGNYLLSLVVGSERPGDYTLQVLVRQTRQLVREASCLVPTPTPLAAGA